MLAENSEDLAMRRASQLGFARGVADWRSVVDECDAIVIAVPSHLHFEIARAAIEQGKAVLCEKPVGLSSLEATDLADAVRAARVPNAVGFTYMRAPLVRHAVALVRNGALGRPLHFRGWHCEDYLADATAPFTWRLDPDLAGRTGALGDLGWHILSIARAFCGQIVALSGSVQTYHAQRPLPDDRTAFRTVGNEDWAGMTLSFESGAHGLIECSRIAHGRKMDIGFELVCENGTVAFHGERMNEIKIYRAGDGSMKSGFETIHCSADHPDYAAFIPAPGHGLGFHDLKVIEMRDFMGAIAEKRGADPDLNQAARIARICEAVLRSHEIGEQISTPEERAE